MWSLGTLPEAIQLGKIKLFNSPSKYQSKQRTRPRSVETLNLSIQEAASISGEASLEAAKAETDWLESKAPHEWQITQEAASPNSLIQAGRGNSFIHFTGHSSANADPLESGLLTYGGAVTVREILTETWNAQLVVLSSCESGLPQNFYMQDEQLSLQSAFWYRGVVYTVGTYWPVRDSVAAEFTKAFYHELFLQVRSVGTDLDAAVYSSWMNAVKHLWSISNGSRVDWSCFYLFGTPTH